MDEVVVVEGGVRLTLLRNCYGEDCNVPNVPEIVQTPLDARQKADGYKMLSNFPDPVLQIAADRRIVWANDAARHFFRQTPVGKNLGKLFRSKAVNTAFKRVLKRGQLEELGQRWGGEVKRDLNLRLNAMSSATDLGGVVLLTIQDVTTYKALDRTRADFIANASHELRTPLATLYGFIETLQGPAKDDPDALDQFLPIMHSHARRMTRLVDDLLSLSRLEMNAERPTDAVNLKEVIGTVVASLGLQAEQQGVTLEFKSKGEPTVPGDAGQLEQVFWNIVENALKYGQPNSTVSIRIKKPRADGSIQVSVADQGEGIDQKHLARLTERFYRVDKARSRGMGGTGLGLAIVKHIIQRHGGSLKVKSKLGVGTTFIVNLPSEEA